MGMVFQAYSLFPHMTARENVELGLRCGGAAPQRRERAADMLELVGLRPGRQVRPPDVGRAAAARGAGAGPGDRAGGAAPRRAAVGARRQGARGCVTRSAASSAPRHDHALRHPRPGGGPRRGRPGGVMWAGRLEQLAAPRLYAHPTSEFVADFVGLTNRLPGAVADGHAAVLGGRGRLGRGRRHRGTCCAGPPRGDHIAADPAGQATVVSGSFPRAHGRVTTAPRRRPARGRAGAQLSCGALPAGHHRAPDPAGTPPSPWQRTALSGLSGTAGART